MFLPDVQTFIARV